MLEEGAQASRAALEIEYLNEFDEEKDKHLELLMWATLYHVVQLL